MPESGNNSLHELQPSVLVEQNLDAAQDISQFEHASTRVRQTESKKTRARVLLGTAILQLPIWGTLPELLNIM